MPNNMKKFLRLGVLLPFIAVLSSCINEYTDWSKCFRAMRIDLYWVNTRPLSDTEEVLITIDPSIGERMILISNPFSKEVDLLADHYNIIGRESADSVSIDAEKGTVSIPVGADGLAFSPVPFSAGQTTADVTYEKDTLVIPLPMYRQTRPLVIEVRMIDKRTPIINAFPPVDELTGILKGITIERDLNNCFPPHDNMAPWPALKNGKIGYGFTLLSDTIKNEVWYTGTKNLIGIDNGTSQILDLELKFQGSDRMDLSFDVTELLDEFQTKDVARPLYILITLSLDSSLNIEIEDWIAGPDSWLIAQ